MRSPATMVTAPGVHWGKKGAAERPRSLVLGVMMVPPSLGKEKRQGSGWQTVATVVLLPSDPMLRLGSGPPRVPFRYFALGGEESLA